jgi:hypothetical protein
MCNWTLGQKGCNTKGCTELVQDYVRWWALVTAEMNLRLQLPVLLFLVHYTFFTNGLYMYNVQTITTTVLEKMKEK